MRAPVPLGLAALLLAFAALGAAPAAAEGAVPGMHFSGDVRADFGQGVLHLERLERADLVGSLSAGAVRVTYVEQEWTTLVELGSGSAAEVDERGDVDGDASAVVDVTEARVRIDGFRGGELLVFTVGGWSDGAPVSFEVLEEDVAGTLVAVEAGRLVDVPARMERDEPAFTDQKQFTYDLPQRAFQWTGDDVMKPSQARVAGSFGLYVYGATVEVTDADGATTTWTTGRRVTEEYPSTPGGRSAYRETYSYLLLTPTDGSLSLVSAPGRLVWYAPQPSLRVTGEVEDTADPADPRRAPSAARGDVTVTARHTAEGPAFDLVPRDVGPASAAPAPAGARLSPWLLGGLVLVGLAVVGLAALAVRWYAWSRFVPTPARSPAPEAPREHPARLPVPAAVTPLAAPPAAVPAAVATVRSAIPPGETTKESVLHLIERRPGLHLSGLAAELHIHRSLAFHHVRDLARKGLVFHIPLGGKHALFRAGAVDPAMARGLAALAAPRTAAAADLLHANPGITIQRVADALGIGARSAARELQRLRAAGLALRDMLANPARFHPSPLLKRLHGGEEPAPGPLPASPAPDPTPAAPRAVFGPSPAGF